MCNLNHHLEHHLLPGIPWYNLRKAHKVLMLTYARAGACVQRSYIGYTIKALRGGPFQEIYGTRLISRMRAGSHLRG